MSHPEKTSRGRETSAFIHAHTAGDPVLDEKRSTTSTEHTLEYHGRQVLYCYNEASAISFCSASGANYAGNMMVKGYVVRWQYATSDRGEALSEIEPVRDRREQEEISSILWPGPRSGARVFFE